MKTIVRAIAIAAAFAAVGSTASAQTLPTVDVNVNVNLTSQCRWNGGTTPGALAVDFTYTAFQAGPVASTTSPTVTVECTRNHAPAPIIDWDGSTNLGVVGGLQYSLSVTAGTTTGGTAATTATIGSGDTTVYTIDGSMPGGQAGDSTAAATDARVLTISF